MANRPVHTLLEHLRRLADDRGRCASADAELLERFVCGRDTAAFELLVWRHGPMVLNVCRRIVRDAHSAEDAFQATFLVLARKAAGISRRAALAGWLYQVAYRVALRARQGIARRATREAPLDDMPEPPAAAAIPAADWLPILDEEIHQLPEKYRLPVVLCHLEGQTLAEAAAALGCPRGTVAVRLHRARQLLRARLSQRGIELPAVFAGVAASRVELSAALVRTALQAGAAGAGGVAVVAGKVSARALCLTEGVLRAMFLKKLQFAVGVLLATTLVGAGAWTMGHSRAGQPPAAANAAAVVQAAEGAPPALPGRVAAREEEDREDRRREEQLKQAERRLQETRERQAVQEEEWLRALIDARVRVEEAQQKVRQLEHELTLIPEGNTPGMEMVKLFEEHNAKAQELERAKAVSKPDSPVVKKFTDEVEAVRARLKQAERKQQEERRRQREELKASLRQARVDFYVAEEKLRQLRRREEREIAEGERDLAAAMERLRQARDAVHEREANRRDPGERQLEELQMKLDQILREVAALRRELQRRSSEGREKP
jgi:RNA polymerase sigma factor (sigma-70 family)